jgi:hypothetical protein
MAHRRLREGDSVRSSTDASLFKEGFKGDEKVQIKGRQIHGVNVLYVRHRF